MDVRSLIRPEITELSAYHVPAADGLVKLDAMENPYSLPPDLQAQLGQRLTQVALNRYPVPTYTQLKQSLADKFGVPTGHDLVLGNGSDELISLVSMACAKPGARVLVPEPSFVMYALAARYFGLEFIGVPVRSDFSLDLAAMLDAIHTHQPALIFLAYPNNPTGVLYAEADIVAILNAAKGIVVVDEAYQPFAQTSFMSRLDEFPHLIVMRTVSKLGLAGIRLGYMAGSNVLMQEFEKCRPPYNINVLSEAAALFALEHEAVFAAQTTELRGLRSQLATDLAALSGVTVFPSAANFVLIRVAHAEQIHAKLLAQKILVKNVGKMHAHLTDCLRITVGSASENALLLAALTAIL